MTLPPLPPKAIWLPATLIIATAVAFYIGLRLGGSDSGQPEALVAKAPTSKKPQPDRPHLARRHEIRQVEDGQVPFWEDAVVPEPGTFREPTAAVPPAADPNRKPRDYAAEVRALENGGDARALNDSVHLWFTTDPAAATAWINSTDRFDALQPSLESLSSSIASSGNYETALQWADALNDEEQRRRALLQVYALKARNAQVTPEELQKAGFNQEEISKALNSSLTD